VRACRTMSSSNTPPPPIDLQTNNWGSFGDRIGYTIADFCFSKAKMSKARIDQLFQIIAALCLKQSHEDELHEPPFSSNTAMEEAIDAISAGDAPWECFVIRYQGERPATNVPMWMDQEFEVWAHNPLCVARIQIANRDFNERWDYAPYQDFVLTEIDGKMDLKRTFKDFMSANWAWNQCVCDIKAFIPFDAC
jgi:hypothetical protein